MLLQVLYYLLLLLFTPLFPLLAWQGKQVRKKVPRLAEAPKNKLGTIDSSGKPLRILLMGESTVAGVGVADHAHGLSGQLAQNLKEHMQRTISWQVVAKSGYTATEVRELLVPQITGAEPGLIILGLGANDAFGLASPLKWRSSMLLLVQALRSKGFTCPIIIAQLPPVSRFPAMPPLLRIFFGTLLGLYKQALADLPAHLQPLYFVQEAHQIPKASAEEPLSEEVFFSDGIHPSAQAYSIWGKTIAAYILQNGILKNY